MPNEIVTRRVQVIIDESGAGPALDRLLAKEKKLITEIEKGTKAGRDMTEALAELDGTKSKISSLEGVISGKLTPSIRQTEAAVKNLRKELNGMSADAPGYAAKLAAFKEVSATLDTMKQKVTGFRSAATSAFSQIKQIALGVTVGNGITAITQSITSLIGGAISGAAKLSDEIADIEKATGLTTKQAEALNNELGKINTRTARSELRQLAISLGQAGEEATTANVKALDQINVALGDEFGGDTREIGNSLSVLRNNLKDLKSGNYADDVTHIGNALNELGANGLATAPVITDIANRVSGVAQTFGVSSGKILGTAAAFQELGINVERGSTAYTKILQKIASDTESFAKVAGMPLKEFKDLVNTDINEALLRVAAGTKTASANNVEFAATLKALDADGSGASELLSKLAANGDLVRSKITLASKALKENGSILSEFEKKNATLGAQVEKLGKNFAAVFNSSTLRTGASGLVGVLNDLFDDTNKASRAFEEATKQFDATSKAIDPLYDRYLALKNQTSLNVAEQQELSHIINQIATIVPSAVTAFDQYGNAIDINTGKLANWRETQKEFIQALNRDAITSLQKDVKQSLKAIEGYNIGVTTALKFGDEARAAQLRSAIAVNQDIALKAADQLIDKYGVELPQKLFDGLNSVRVAIGQAARIANELKTTDPSLKIADASQFDLFPNAASAALANDVAARRAKLEALISELKTSYEKLNLADKTGQAANLKLREQYQKELDALDGKFNKTARTKGEDTLKQLIKDLESLERGIVLDKITDQHARALQQLSDKYDQFFKRTKGNIELTKRILNDFLSELQIENNKFKGPDPGAPIDLNPKVDNSAEIEAQLAARKAERFAAAELASLNATGKEKLKLDLQFLELEKNQKISNQNLTGSALLLLEKEYAEKRHNLETNFLNESGNVTLKARLKSIQAVLDVEINALNKQEETEVQQAEKTGTNVNAIHQKFANQRAEIYRQSGIAVATAVLDQLQTVVNFASSANQVLDNLENGKLNRLKAQHDQELASYDNMLGQKIISQKKHDRLASQLNTKFDKEQKEIQRKQFIRSKVINAAQAAISTALAVLNALSTVHPYFPAGVAAAASAGVIGAFHVAAILSEPVPSFGKGGFVPNGSSHAEGGIGIRDNKTGRYLGTMEGDEPIISKSVYRANKPLVDALLANGYHRDFTPITPSWMTTAPKRINIPLVSRSVSTRKYFADGGFTPSTDSSPGSNDLNNQLLQALLTRLNEPIIANVIYGTYEAKKQTLDNIRKAGTIA